MGNKTYRHVNQCNVNLPFNIGVVSNPTINSLQPSDFFELYDSRIHVKKQMYHNMKPQQLKDIEYLENRTNFNNNWDRK